MNCWKIEENPSLCCYTKGRNDHNSLRGIRLRTVLGKVYEGVLNGMVERIDINVGKEQGGFRRGRVCVNLIFCVKNKV